MPKIIIEPRKTARQLRSEVTREIILEAAARVLSKKSLEGFNTNRVAEVAGVSIGTLYQYFPNKESLIAVLIERTQKGYVNQMDQLGHDTEGMPLRDTLLKITKVMLNHKYSEPLLAIALDHQELRLPVEDILNDTKQQCLDGFTTFLLHYRSEFQNDFPRYVAHDCMHIAKVIMEESMKGSAEIQSDLDMRITCAIIGYLKEITSKAST
jgi:AcrR family transcriptional regulator